MKIAVITGASSGIGLATSVELAKNGYSIIGIGRDEARCKAAKEQILTDANGDKVWMIVGDLMQQREVLRVAEQVGEILTRENEGRLDVLINNAGCVRSWYTTSEEGYEQQFALNHLSGFLLTHALLPHLLRAKGRVLMTGSESHKGVRIRWNDVMLRGGYNPLLAYKQSKLCNILFAKGLNERYDSLGLRAYTVDPGLVCTDIGNKSTGGIVDLVWKLRKKHGAPPEVPAKTFAYLCEQQPAPTGLYYYLCKPNSISRQVTSVNADRLFALSEQLCGIRYPTNASLLEQEESL